MLLGQTDIRAPAGIDPLLPVLVPTIPEWQERPASKPEKPVTEQFMDWARANRNVVLAVAAGLLLVTVLRR